MKTSIYKLVRECMIDVLSEGGNWAGETNNSLFKDRQGGRDVYWIWSSDEERNIYIRPEAVQKYLSGGYTLIDLQNAGQQVNEAFVKKCIKEILMEELGTKIVREENPISKTRGIIYSKLKALGFQSKGNTPHDYMEYYRYNFATIQCVVDWYAKTVTLDLHYDSERLANDGNMRKPYHIPEPYNQEFVDKIVLACKRLKSKIDGDDAVMGGMEDDLQQEGFDPQSMGGPNPEATEGNSVENPYAAWNSKMRKMEEGHDFNSVEDENPAATPEAQNFPYASQNATMRKMEEEQQHGRYAQEAGAGQFDPRTFGVNP